MFSRCMYNTAPPSSQHGSGAHWLQSTLSGQRLANSIAGNYQTKKILLIKRSVKVELFLVGSGFIVSFPQNTKAYGSNFHTKAPISFILSICRWHSCCSVCALFTSHVSLEEGETFCYLFSFPGSKAMFPALSSLIHPHLQHNTYWCSLLRQQT